MRRIFALLALLGLFTFSSLALADSVSVSSSIPDGSTLKGCVRWDVTVSPGGVAAGVRYVFGNQITASGVLVSSSSESDSYRFGDSLGSGYLDTRPMPSGLYQISAIAVDANGDEIGRLDETVEVATGNKNCANRLK